MFQDLRYGLRLMVRRPGFAAVAVATLALGIGTTTAIFAVTDRVLLRPVPYADPERLAVIWETPPNHPLPIMFASPPNLHEWQVRSQTFAAMGGFQWRDVTLGGSDPERIRGARLTAGLLPALGVQPQIGRLFLPEEDRAGGRPVVLISDALWRRRFQQDPAILGRTVPIDGVPTEIIGVMPPGFECPPAVVLRGPAPAERAELWVPHATNLETGQRGAHYLAVIGRLRPGASFESAHRELNDIQAQIEREFPDYRGWRANVVPLVDAGDRDVAARRRACSWRRWRSCCCWPAPMSRTCCSRAVWAGGANSRSAPRSAPAVRDWRCRSSPNRFALALAGGDRGPWPGDRSRAHHCRAGPGVDARACATSDVNARTAMFAIAASVLSAVLAGAIPALGVIRTRLASWLADRSGGSGPGGLRAQQALVVGQIGMAVALLVTAALLVESFRQLRAVDPGFEPDAGHHREAHDSHVAISGRGGPCPLRRRAVVQHVGVARRRAPPESSMPCRSPTTVRAPSFERLDGPAADPSASQNANVAWITDGYLESMGVPLLAGRAFTARDTARYAIAW